MDDDSGDDEVEKLQCFGHDGEQLMYSNIPCSYYWNDLGNKADQEDADPTTLEIRQNVCQLNVSEPTGQTTMAEISFAVTGLQTFSHEDELDQSVHQINNI